MKNFFVVIDGSEDVLYLKCLNLCDAKNEVKRYLGVDALDYERVEIIY